MASCTSKVLGGPGAELGHRGLLSDQTIDAQANSLFRQRGRIFSGVHPGDALGCRNGLGCPVRCGRAVFIDFLVEVFAQEPSLAL
jgi:hypothetical protein